MPKMQLITSFLTFQRDPLEIFVVFSKTYFASRFQPLRDQQLLGVFSILTFRLAAVEAK
jgi:hypothetical protein